MRLFVLVALSLIVRSSGEDAKAVVGARVESCPSCSLNRLPEVKKFIYEDLPNYEGVEFKRIHGAPPELVLLDADGEEADRLPLSKLTRAECNALMEERGMVANKNKNSEL